MFTVLTPQGRSLGLYYRTRKAAALAARDLALVGLPGYRVAFSRGR